MMLDRRRFLDSTAKALLAAAAGTAWEQTGQAAEKTPRGSKKIIVGAHPWVYAATQPKNDIYPILERIFADMSYAGLDGIELMHTALQPADAFETIRALSKKYALPIIGTSFGGNMWDRAQHEAVFEDAQTVVNRLADLGGWTFGVSVGRAPQPKTPAQFDAQAELLRGIIALCQSRNVVLNLHNHTYEVENDLYDLKGTLARIPDVKLGPDLNWLVRGGVDPVRFIKTYGRQIVFLHLRDQKADGKWSEAMGEGNMDYAAIGKALQEIGFTGDAVIELAHERDFKPTRPLRDSLKMSRAYVRQTLGF
ncbi:MAG: sugar phosphate isomerase/epimerase [Planctomycetes bacterium]|nr:sugar phosphate isomerase/epimerase [Planctomycetota bacterium]